MHQIYLGTISMEINRRFCGENLALRVSDYVERIKQDGFYGIELWQYHYTCASDEEKAKLASANIPFIFSSYLSLEEYDEESYRAVADAVHALKAVAVKYNFGRSKDTTPDIPKQLENLKKLTAMLPEYTKMICECHANTIAEFPEDAVKLFSQLDKERFGAIVHLPENIELADRCYKEFGDRIWHIHCQYRPEGAGCALLDDGTDFVASTLKHHIENGFDGSVTIEFLKAEETVEEHYANAVADLKYLNSFPWA